MASEQTYFITVEVFHDNDRGLVVTPDMVEHIGITKEEFCWSLAETTKGHVEEIFVIYAGNFFFDIVDGYLHEVSSLGEQLPKELHKRLQTKNSLEVMVVHAVEYTYQNERSRYLFLIPFNESLGAYPLCIIKGGKGNEKIHIVKNKTPAGTNTTNRNITDTDTTDTNATGTNATGTNATGTDTADTNTTESENKEVSG